MSKQTMHVDIIRTREGFDRIRDDWECVYATDPDAQIYLSWTWLSGWFGLLDNDWIVLAARKSDSQGHVAFFPIRIRTKITPKGKAFSEVAMAGNRFADYTGFICTPEFALQSISAFAQALKAMPWASLQLEGLRTSEENLNHLRSCFADEAFSIRRITAVDKCDGTDQSVCPYVDLPPTWDAYLATLSASRRQKFRKLLRELSPENGMYVRHADAGTLSQDLDLLLGLWKERWRHRKGEQADVLARNMAAVLERSHKSGLLDLMVLHANGEPVAAHANFQEPTRQEIYFLVGARKPDFIAPPPGLILHAYAVKRSIERGFERYDFLRGNEPYKYTFANGERRIESLVVTPTPTRIKAGVLHPLSIPETLRRAQGHLIAGRLGQAERLCLSALAASPGHIATLYKLGEIKLAWRRGRAAERIAEATSK
jgi:CelD/BcsL family acetyltransferase involved in cellulose biosynthesis